MQFHYYRNGAEINPAGGNEQMKQTRQDAEVEA
jgi:hypothetical protein